MAKTKLVKMTPEKLFVNQVESVIGVLRGTYTDPNTMGGIVGQRRVLESKSVMRQVDT
jgi:hypothetical protein